MEPSPPRCQHCEPARSVGSTSSLCEGTGPAGVSDQWVGSLHPFRHVPADGADFDAADPIAELPESAQGAMQSAAAAFPRLDYGEHLRELEVVLFPPMAVQVGLPEFPGQDVVEFTGHMFSFQWSSYWLPHSKESGLFAPDGR